MDLKLLLFIMSFEVFFSRLENVLKGELGLPYPELLTDAYNPLWGFLLNRGGALLAFLYGSCLPIPAPSSPELS